MHNRHSPLPRQCLDGSLYMKGPRETNGLMTHDQALTPANSDEGH